MTKKILVVDDHPETLRLISFILERADYQVTTARSGLAGIEAAREVVPDLVLLDIMMPGMDGVEVCKQLREDSNPDVANMTIVMFSARSMMTDRDEAFAAEADGYIVKPTRPKELVGLVKNYIDNPRQQSGETADAPTSHAVIVCRAGENRGVAAIVTRLAKLMAEQDKTAICVDAIGDIDPKLLQPAPLFNVPNLDEAHRCVEEHANKKMVVNVDGTAAQLVPLLSHASALVVCISEHVESISAAKTMITAAKPHLNTDVSIEVVQISSTDAHTIPAESVNLLLGHQLAAAITHEQGLINLSSQQAVTAWANDVLGNA